jgi:5'-nucleotidase
MASARACRWAGALGALLATAATIAAPAAARPGQGEASRTAEAQLLALNDFHGHLEATTPGTIRIDSDDPPEEAIPAGGSEYLATHVRRLEATNRRNTLVVSAGDLIGASPLVSALFHDEPTIEAMNRIGLDLNAVGNHEFDDGVTELRRMARGGCHPVDGCVDRDGDGDADRFRGARFGFLAANVVRESTGRPIFPPYAIRRLGGVRVGFIGMTLEGTPDIVAAAGIQGLSFLDEAETANRYAAELRRRGVEAIVVLLHEGAAQTPPFNINGCNGLSGPAIDIVNRSDDAIDLFITGHTHQAYNCVIDGRPVTSASSFGRLLTDIDVELSRRTRDFTEIRANNVVVRQTDADGVPVPRAPDISQLVAHYQALAAPRANAVIGHLAAAATKAADDSGEHQAGDLIADAQLASTAEAAGAVAAFMNPGGVRGDTGFPGGAVTYGQAFTVQPFGNTLVTMSLTGAQLLEVLKQQWCGQSGPRILLPSASVAYSFSQSVAASVVGQPCAGAANPVSDLRIAGVAVDPAASYRVTVNSFLADGGDLFTVLRDGTDRTGGALDLDALVAYLAPTSPAAPLPVPALDRIDVVP